MRRFSKSLAVSLILLGMGLQQIQLKAQSSFGEYLCEELIVRTMILGTLAAIGSCDYWGVRVGYNASSYRLHGEVPRDADASGISSGMNAGLIFGYYLGQSPLDLEWGMSYSGKGGCYSAGSSSADFRLHCFELPLVLKYNVPVNPTKNIFLQPFAGAYCAFNCGGEVQVDHHPHDRYSATLNPMRDRLIRTFDGGLRVGCGMALKWFYVEASYDWGLSNLMDSDFYYRLSPAAEGMDGRLRSSCLGVTMGVNF